MQMEPQAYLHLCSMFLLLLHLSAKRLLTFVLLACLTFMELFKVLFYCQVEPSVVTQCPIKETFFVCTSCLCVCHRQIMTQWAPGLGRILTWMTKSFDKKCNGKNSDFTQCSGLRYMVYGHFEVCCSIAMTYFWQKKVLRDTFPS